MLKSYYNYYCKTNKKKNSKANAASARKRNLECPTNKINGKERPSFRPLVGKATTRNHRITVDQGAVCGV